MATDFNINSYKTPYGFSPEPDNTPLDSRTRVNTFADIASIPNPFVGMQVYVVDSGEMYLVKQIDEREEGLSVEYFINISTDEDKERSLARVANSDNLESIIGPVEGVAYLTSYVFTKSTSVPGTPEGGCFTFPYPTFDGAATGDRDENWHDTVPSNGKGAVYMSYRTFCSDPSKSGEWTEPRKLADSANFQVEFTADDLSKKPDYKISTFTGNEAAWRQTEKNKGVTWGDDTDIVNPLYMATAVCHNDVWGNWTVVKIKGEKGDKGDKGESAKVSFKGKFSTLEKMVEEWDVYRNDKNNYSPNRNTDRFLLPLEVGDGYIVETNGCLYVYNGEDSEFDEVWTNVGQIKGDSAYIYVRYSDSPDGLNMWDPADNPKPGKYIGIKCSELPLNEADLLNPATFAPWTLWRGDDGWGYEQVFLLTHKTNGNYDETYGPAVPTDRQDTPDYLPKHNISTSNVKGGADNTRWSDRPLSTSETWPLCWVVTRKVGKEYTDWKGDANERAILYSKYSVDGLPGSSPIYLELTNDRAELPLENGVIDPDFKATQTVTTTMKLFEGNNPLTNGVTYSISPASAGTLSGATVTLNLNNLDNVTEVECTATYNNKPYSRTLKIYKTNNAYEIVPSEYILVKDDSGSVTSTSTLTVTVNKWDSLNNKWIVPTDKTLFVKYFFEGSTSPEVVSKTISNPINITLKKNLSGIRFFITENNTQDGEEISHEQIGVIKNVNGVDGSTYKTSYAFVRCADNEIANVVLTGGDWDTPIPNPVALGGKTYTWEDTVPAGEDAIWVATRQFKYGDINFDPTWSSPRKMADSADFEVEFSAGLKKADGTLDIETKPTLKSLNGFASIDAWKNDSQHKDWNWVDGSQAAGAIWMATSVKHGATWTDWSVVKVKGEKGERGSDGTSVNIKGTVNSEEELYAIQNPSVGDGYILGEDLWIYTEEGVWKNVGPIKGPAGSSMYLYVRCSNDDGSAKVLLPEGETGKWIGYHVSVDILDDDELQILSNNNKFTWTKWTGEDGWGYEQIYLLTTGAGYAFDKGPQINGNAWYNDPSQDFLPEHRLGTEAMGGADDHERWSDIPLVPTDEFPYCWELKRRVSGLVNGKWTNCGNWITDKGGRAILYDRYILDGVNSVHLELDNTFAAVPCDEKGNVDLDLGTDLASTGLQLYDGGVAVPDSEVTYSYVPASGFTAKCEGKTVTVTSLTADYVFVACKATYKEKDYFRNFRVQKRDAAWRITLDGINVIRKTYDTNGNLQIVADPVGFKVEKWNDIKWETNTTKKIFVSYSINGQQTIKHVANNSFDFSSVDVNATDFRAFITDNNTSTGMVLDIENIGVVIDGKDGANGKDTYSIELTNDLGIIPLESNGDIDRQAEDITTQIVMLKGNEIITKDDNVTYSINVATSTAIRFNTSTGLLTISPSNFTNASDIPTSIVCTAKHGNVTLDKTFHISVTMNAYELIPHKHMLQRDLSTGYLVDDDKTLGVSIRKWDAENNKWIVPTQTLYVHVDCEHIGTANHTNNVFNAASSGEVSLDLSGEKELKSIRLYLSESNNLATAKENYLTYENLGVYANGEDGSEIEFIYYLNTKEELPMNPTPTGDLGNNKNYQVQEWTPSKYISAISGSSYSTTSGSVMTTQLAAKWTDNPQGVSETNKFQYVAQRKKVGGIWQAFSTPTLWSSYGTDGTDGDKGDKGDKGDNAVVTQLTNPASIVNVIDSSFVPNTVTTKVQIRSGIDFVKINKVSISSVQVNGEVKTSYSNLVTLTSSLDSSKFENNVLTFTLGSGLAKATSVMNVTVNIETELGNFEEVKTISIQKVVQPCHLELTNDAEMIYTDSAGNVPNTVIWPSTTPLFYQGSKLITSVTPEVVGDGCTYTVSNGVYTINAITKDVATLKFTVTYDGSSYSKEFTITKSFGTPTYKIVATPNVIVEGETTSVNVKVMWFDGRNRTEEFTSANVAPYSLTLNGQKINPGPVDISVFSRAENIIEFKNNTTVLDSETIGKIKNGVDGKAIHLELTNDVASVAQKDIVANTVNVSTTAELYEGESKVTSGITYKYDYVGCEGTGSNGTVTVNKVTSDLIYVKITATYKGADYVKTFHIIKTRAKWELRFNYNVINLDDPKAIIAKLYIDDQFKTNPSGVNIQYSIDGVLKGSIATTGQLEIPVDTIKTVKDNIRFDVMAENIVVESETLGVVHNGADGLNAEYYQIDADHRWIIKNVDGSVKLPTVKITPKFTKINGNEITELTFTEISNAGYELYTATDGVFDPTKKTSITQYLQTSAMTGVQSQFVFYLYKKGVNPSSATGWVDYVEVDVIQERAGEFTEAEKEIIAGAIEDAVLENLNNAYCTKEELEDLEGALREAIENGDNTAIADASAALDRAKELNNAITVLNGYFDENGKLRKENSALTENDIYDLSLAALGINPNEGPDNLGAESVFAKYVVGAVGKFVKLSASQIEVDQLIVAGKMVTFDDVGDNQVQYIAVGDAASMTGVKANTLYIVI